MAQPANPTVIADVAALIKAIASLLWPLLGLYVAVRHEKQIRELFSRLRKGKLLGQEIELDSSLKELERQVSLVEEQARPPELTPILADPDQSATTQDGLEPSQDFVTDVLANATKAPTVALIQLAAGIERLSSEIWSDLDDGTQPSRPTARRLVESLSEVLPPNAPAAIRAFWDVRNRIVHGRDADPDEVISAIDSGLSLWKALKDFSRSYVEVVRCAIPLFSDEEGKVQIPDATGVELRMKHGPVREQVLPTTRDDYRPQMMLRWDWTFDRKFGQTWYRDQLTGEMRSAFLGSATFIGEPISVRMRS